MLLNDAFFSRNACRQCWAGTIRPVDFCLTHREKRAQKQNRRKQYPRHPMSVCIHNRYVQAQKSVKLRTLGPPMSRHSLSLLRQSPDNVEQQICLRSEHIGFGSQLHSVVIEGEPLVSCQSHAYRRSSGATANLQTGTYLVAHTAVADIMTGVNFANVHDSAHKVVRARPRQLVCLLRIRVSSTICVGQHIQLQGEIDLRLDFGRGLVSGPISELKPLQSQSVSMHTHPCTSARIVQMREQVEEL